MSAFIGRLLVLFYVITIPVFLGLYVASMVYAKPKYDALWIEGGVTEYGPAAFLVLLAIFVFPVCVSICHYLLTHAQTYLKKVLIISAWMAPWPIGSAVVAKELRTEFPMAITMIKDDLILWVIVWVIGVAYMIYSMHEELSLEAKRREEVATLARRHGVSKVDVVDMTSRLSAITNTWNRSQGRQQYDYYLALHFRHFNALKLSVDDYWSFVCAVIGEKSFFNDAALVELYAHIKMCSRCGGVDSYYHWLAELRRFGLRDKSLEHFFGTYSRSGEVSLDNCLLEYRIGEFTTVTEYLEFLKASPPLYVSAAERAKYQAEADKMTHPVLHRMLELGGFYRARALQIAQRSFSREFPVARPAPASAPSSIVDLSPQAVVGTSHSDSTPSSRSGTVMVSRRGQIIFNDINLQNLSTMVMQGHVLLTDHYWCSGMPGWSLVSSYRRADTPLQVAKEGVNWGEVFTDFFLSWLLYVLGGVFIAGLLGYGTGGMSGVGSAIGGFLGLIILVRPVTFVFRTLFRLVIGKRGMELFR